MNLHVCALVPQDDYNSYLVETPDKARIKVLMESEATMRIGKATKNALSTCTKI